MSLKLLTEIQHVNELYAEARLALDAAHARGDRHAVAKHSADLIAADEAWKPLAARFADETANVESWLETGMTVVWRRGSVGQQGVLTNFTHVPNTRSVFVKVATKHGVYSEHAHNLMPLDAVAP